MPTDRLAGYRRALEEHFCITVTDNAGRLIEANERFCNVVGYSEQELAGQHYELLCPGWNDGSIERMWAAVKAARRGAASFAIAPRPVRKSGSNPIVIPRLGNDGQIEQFITHQHRHLRDPRTGADTAGDDRVLPGRSCSDRPGMRRHRLQQTLSDAARDARGAVRIRTAKTGDAGAGFVPSGATMAGCRSRRRWSCGCRRCSARCR